MSLMFRFLIIVGVAFLAGCAISYKRLDSTNNEHIVIESKINCSITYSLSISWILNSKEYIDFKRSPYKEDYIEWTNQVLSESQCKPVLVKSDAKPDIDVKVTDLYPYGDVGQGEGILLMFTLWVIPIPSEYGHRQYVFEANETVKQSIVKERNWFGWIFLPFHIASYYPYEEAIYKEQLREYINGKKN